MKQTFDICIVGGGAAGLCALVESVTLAPDAKILLLEKNEKLGRKLYATGNGRCNLTNRNIPGVEKTLSFFGSLGLATKEEEEGRIYPASEEAADVVFVLEQFIESHEVTVETGAHVTDIFPETDENRAGSPAETGGFRILYEKSARENDTGSASDKDGTDSKESREVFASKVLLAMGGKAGPMYGTIGEGFALAKKLGHTVKTPYPVLTGVETIGGNTDKTQTGAGNAVLKGVRADALVSLLKNGQPIFEERGQVQFTDYGLSGVVIFNASRFIRLEGAAFSDYTLCLDFVPEVSPDFLAEQMGERLQRGQDPLRSFVPEKLCRYIRSHAVPKSGNLSDAYLPGGDLSGVDLSNMKTNLARALKCLPFTVIGVRGWKMAQCTGGGVMQEEIHGDTMESAILPGLYLAGEMVEGDGPCGGYNLDRAFTQGRIAGRAMAHAL